MGEPKAIRAWTSQSDSEQLRTDFGSPPGHSDSEPDCSGYSWAFFKPVSCMSASEAAKKLRFRSTPTAVQLGFPRAAQPLCLLRDAGRAAICIYIDTRLDWF